MADYSQNKILLSPGELFATFLLIQKSKCQWNALILTGKRKGQSIKHRLCHFDRNPECLRDEAEKSIMAKSLPPP
ncbi:MAG: hypothetical protein PVI44_12925, partial [Balneolaceae bacterium]